MSEGKTKLSALISADAVKKITESLKLLDSIESVEVKTEDQYDNAGKLQRDIQGANKEIEELRKADVSPLDVKVKQINEKYKGVQAQLLNGKTKIGDAMKVYYVEQDNKRKEKQRLIDADIEEKRQKAVAAAQAERDKAEKYEAEGRTAMAEKAEARADTKMEEAVTTVAPVLAEKKTSGIHYQDTFSAEITDFNEAVKTLMASPFLIGNVNINIKGLNAAIKKVKGKIELPGFKVTKGSKQVVRS